MSSQHQGWTPGEAIRRTASPEILKALRRASRRAKYATLGWLMQTPEGIAACQELTRKLSIGLFVTMGRRDSATAETSLIRPSELEGLRIDPVERSAIAETAGDTVLFDVRIFPFLQAPNPLDYLHGKTILEAVELYVFGDPQVVALRARAETIGGNVRDIRLLRHSPNAFWRVALSPTPPWNNPVGFLLGDDPKHIAGLAADFVLEQRFEHLMDYLRRGLVIAEGTDQAGSRSVVPRVMWGRENTFIHLANQDLVESLPEIFPPDYSPPLYRGLQLQAPRSADTFHVKGTEYAVGASLTVESARTGAKPSRTPRRDDLLAALRKASIDLRTCELTTSQIIAEVSPLLDKPPNTDPDEAALRKLINRLRADVAAR